MALEEFVHQLAEYVALLVNLLAILAIAIGSVQGAIGLTGLLLFKADESKLMPVWMSFGRWAVAGLSFPACGRYRGNQHRPDLGGNRQARGDRGHPHLPQLFPRPGS